MEVDQSNTSHGHNEGVKHTIIIWYRKNTWQHSTPFLDKNTQQIKKNRKQPLHNKNHNWKPMAKVTLYGEKLQILY